MRIIKKLKLILLSSTGFLFVSCTAEEGLREQEIVMGAQIRNDNSPTGYIDLQIGEQVGAYIVARTGEDTDGSFKPAGNLFDNLLLSYQSGALKPQNQIYYPVGIGYVDYYAYAPYSAGTAISSNHSMTFLVQRNKSTADALKKSDLLWSKLLKVSTAPTTSPSLTFEHSLSKLIIKFRPGIGITLTDPTNFLVPDRQLFVGTRCHIGKTGVRL